MPTPRVLARSGLRARPLPSAVLARNALRAAREGSNGATLAQQLEDPSPDLLAATGACRRSLTST